MVWWVTASGGPYNLSLPPPPPMRWVCGSFKTCAKSSSSRRLRYLASFSFGALKLIMDTFEDNLSASQKEEAESQQAYES